MSAFVLRAQQYPASPWKNGLGVTRTVAISPTDSNLTSFDWRISMAAVGERTSFSPLPGVDRWLMPAAGQAIAVNVDGLEQVLQIGDVLAFSGDSTTSGGVIGDEATGSTPGSRDLNLMMRRPYKGANLESLILQYPTEISAAFTDPDDTSIKVLIFLDDELDLGITKLHQFDAVVVGTKLNGTNHQPVLAKDSMPEQIELPDDWFTQVLSTDKSTASPTIHIAVATICG